MFLSLNTQEGWRAGLPKPRGVVYRSSGYLVPLRGSTKLTVVLPLRPRPPTILSPLLLPWIQVLVIKQEGGGTVAIVAQAEWPDRPFEYS